MFWLNLVRLILNLRNISFFLKVHRIFRKDNRYSVFNPIRAMWEVSKDDRILRHGKVFVHSRYLLFLIGVKTLDIAGFCMGGAFALDFALRHQRLIDKVFLIETTIHFPLFMKAVLVPEIGRKMLQFGLKSPLGSWLVFQYLLKRGLSYHEEFLSSFALNNVDISRRYIKLVRDYGRIDHFKRVRGKLKSQLIIVCGERSPYYIAHSNRKLLKTGRITHYYKI